MYKSYITEHWNIVGMLHRLSDLLAIVAAFLLSLYFTAETGYPTASYIFSLIVSILIAFWLYPVLGLYRIWRGESRIKELMLSAYAWTVNQIILAGVYSVSGSEYRHDNTFFIQWYVFGLILLLSARFTVRIVLNIYRAKGRDRRTAIIIGNDKIAQDLVNNVLASPWTGYHIAGSFGDSKLDNVDYLGSFELIEQYIEQNGTRFEQIWIALPLSDQPLVETLLLTSLRNATQAVRYIPDMRGFRLINHSVGELLGMPVINVSVSPMSGLNRVAKSIEDKILAAIILLLISPLMLILAIGVKLSSPGPVFYRQDRVSWNGHSFMMLKFRSMPVDNEKNGVQWGNAKNKKMTKFGQFIRKTSLDELPQFINVLKGDMSIVGPRPERTVFVDKFKDEIPGYMQKHMVKAGITGWAQINGWRGDTDLKKRIEHDLYYIDNWSLWFDIKIILLTFLKGFVHKNAA